MNEAEESYHCTQAVQAMISRTKAGKVDLYDWADFLARERQEAIDRAFMSEDEKRTSLQRSLDALTTSQAEFDGRVAQLVVRESAAMAAVHEASLAIENAQKAVVSADGAYAEVRRLKQELSDAELLIQQYKDREAVAKQALDDAAVERVEFSKREAVSRAQYETAREEAEVLRGRLSQLHQQIIESRRERKEQTATVQVTNQLPTFGTVAVNQLLAYVESRRKSDSSTMELITAVRESYRVR